MRRGVLAVSMVLTAGCGAGDESAVDARSVESILQPQQIVAIELSPADAVLAAKFTGVSSVRELSTGRILVTDERENSIVLADFRMENTALIGRRGRGPEEYGHVGRLWPLAGDSSLMYDRFQGRWLLFSGARIIGTISASDDAVRATRSERILGADTAHVIATVFPRSRALPTTDSADIVRVRRSDGHSETISRAMPFNDGMPLKFSVAGAAGAAAAEKTTYVMSLIVNDQVAHFTDGWTAIARHNPYRVDWCPPEGKCIPGPVLESPRPMTDTEKRAHLAVAEEMMGWPHTKSVDETDDSWPKLVPPFVEPMKVVDASPVYPLPDGRLLVERFPTGVPQWTYDVVDRRGVIVGRLTLPRGERIVAIGKSSIYTVVRDEFELEELRRHPWLTKPLPIERE